MVVTRLARNTAPTFSTNRRGQCRVSWFGAVLLGALVLAGQAGAQSAPDPVQVGQPKITAIDPPRSAVADQYRATAARNGVQTDATYAATLDGKLRSDGSFVPPKKRAEPSDYTAPSLSGNVGIWVVLAVLPAALALWLRFGGSGMLLSKGPGEIAEKPIAPEGWKLPDTQAMPAGGDIFAAIRAMADRRAAMVVLLRISLLQAATTSGTRFARSDTEREALRRLPPSILGRSILTELLREAELAHYGGREVTEETLHRCIDRARAVFAVKALPA